MASAAATILVVGRHPLVRAHLELTLAAAGYEVLVAGDAPAALSLLRAQPVDLILKDCSANGSKASRLERLVREHQTWRRIPFVHLTTRFDTDAAGADCGDWLAEPIEPEDLLAALRDRLRRRPVMSDPAL